MSQYTCTIEQFRKAQEMFLPYLGKPEFQKMYDIAIQTYCDYKFAWLIVGI